MERVNKILNHDLFKECVEKNRMAEVDRRFCHHDMRHFLDVARLAMIFYLQEGMDVSEKLMDAEGIIHAEDIIYTEEIIYAAALLHDIGRWKQYEDGTPHEKASAALTPGILADCGFTEAESALVISAILNHRNAAVKEERTLDGILYRADKMSRSCFCCEVEKECDWKGDKKNLVLRY